MDSVFRARFLGLCTLVLAVAISFSSRAVAGFIPIVNAGIENPSLGEAGLTTNSVPDGTIEAGAGQVGIYNPTNIRYPGGVAPEGQNVAYSVAGQFIAQSLPATWTAGTHYELRVMSGAQAFVGTPYGGFSVELLACTTVITSNIDTTIVAPGTFVNIAASYDALSGFGRLRGRIQLAN